MIDVMVQRAFLHPDASSVNFTTCSLPLFVRMKASSKWFDNAVMAKTGSLAQRGKPILITASPPEVDHSPNALLHSADTT